MAKRLQLVVFDLDYTIWKPEMYQLFGAPQLTDAPKNMSWAEKKASKTSTPGKVITDDGGSIITVFPGASLALTEINKLRSQGHDIMAAVASRTDNPSWAYFCMENLVVSSNNTTLLECFGGGNLIEINFNDKTHHFRSLHEKTNIAYENMVFFDNEEWNITKVSRLGVTCIHTEDGMQKEHWDEAKKAFGL